eukprot:CAMPEP_0177590668 /NCGR_PEP_ID=MMETSP0419_2-20121207/7545_1 /TAXON_ID=582737 /ORGANISM="Tetraselmis sp., Strain GSL018" /LENGTH=41 /DNA_ID= /DNA_START= /DNA_END= /DNA_ORIENTATION=
MSAWHAVRAETGSPCDDPVLGSQAAVSPIAPPRRVLPAGSV